MSLRLVIFDVDGTLVDSQADILGAMHAAFEAESLAAPARSAILSIVGLSLPQAMARLVPDSDAVVQARMVESYKAAYAANRLRQTASETAPLYPGARDVIEALHAQDNILLAIATGKSRRGLTALLQSHDLDRYFISTQVADDHPSKPHPSMIMAALGDAGVDPRDAVMIGDTTFDMQMSQAAATPFIGVSWGYHPARAFSGALQVMDRFDELPPFLHKHWSFQT